VVIIAVVFATQSVQLNEESTVTPDGIGSISYWIISALVSATWLSALGLNMAWDKKILGTGPTESSRIIRSSCYLFGLVAIVSYLTRAEIARSYLGDRVAAGAVRLAGWSPGMAPVVEGVPPGGQPYERGAGGGRHEHCGVVGDPVTESADRRFAGGRAVPAGRPRGVERIGWPNSNCTHSGWRRCAASSSTPAHWPISTSS
jgi:hypothetical protein